MRLMNPDGTPTDRSIFARLSRRNLAAAPVAVPAAGSVAIREEPAPEDDNFYFETSITSPAVQLSVWELLNDKQEPHDGLDDGEPLDEGVLAPGHTATVEFWTGDEGQTLLHAFDDGPAAVPLAGWLAETFPNLYGPGGADLAEKTNANVAALALRLAGAAEPRLESEVLALALACYATREFLGGPAAVPFAFRVSPLGVTSCVCNIGTSGEPFRVANGSSLTVLQLLLTLDAQTTAGVPLAGNDALRQQACELLELVNHFGDIRT